MKKILLTSALTIGLGLGFALSASALPLGGVLQNELDIRTDGGSSSVNVLTEALSDSADSHWSYTGTQGGAATLFLEYATLSDFNVFGMYDLDNTDNRLVIFPGFANGTQLPVGSTPDNAQASVAYNPVTNIYTAALIPDPDYPGEFNTATFGSGENFGYFLERTDESGITWFSDTGLNADNYDHMFAYQGEGDGFDIFLTGTGIYSPWTTQEYVLAWEDLVGGGDQDFTDFVVMVESVEPFEAVPEPATMILLGSGLVSLAGLRLRRKKK